MKLSEGRAGRLILGVSSTFVLLLFAWGQFNLFSRPTLVQAQPKTLSVDPRFILQMEAGLSAYSQLTTAISPAYVRPIFVSVDTQNDDYILGAYQLSGRSTGDVVKLLVHRNGWAMAYYPRSSDVSKFFDCGGYPYLTDPSFMPNQLETAIQEVAGALNITNVTVSYYDFRYPQADHITLLWLLQRDLGQISATLTPPLANTYYERGFGFCTVTYYGELYVNSQLIAKGDRTSIFGLLAANQLRPGQANTISVNQRLVFWFSSGLMGGVAIVYEDNAEVTSSGGYRRDFILNYPTMIGEPISIHLTYLPLIKK